MGCYEMMCLACGEEHIDDQDVCIVELCQLIWQREGAPDPKIPGHLSAIYSLYGGFDPVSSEFYGKVALFDVDSVDARDMEDLLSSVPETTDYIFSVMATAAVCIETKVAAQRLQQAAQSAAGGGGA
jgi:hypothetical protein